MPNTNVGDEGVADHIATPSEAEVRATTSTQTAQTEDGLAAEDPHSQDPLSDESQSGDAATAAAAESIEGRLMAAQAERDEYLESLMRLQAEFTNYRNATEGRVKAEINRGVGRVVESLLGPLDAFDQAAGQNIEGLAAIHKTLLDALSKLGLSKLEVMGNDFDPAVHEAVGQTGGAGRQVVAEVYRSGYMFNGAVLRPAMVVVGHIEDPGGGEE